MSEILRANSLSDLNKKARKELMKANISKSAADIAVLYFTGYINGDERVSVNLLRIDRKWFVQKERVLSLKGRFEGFRFLKTTLV